MTDDQQADIYRAQRATTLLADPMMAEALAAIRNGVRDAFFDLPTEAVTQRELLHQMDKARQHFENIFRAHVMGGFVSRETIESEEKAAEYLAMIQEKVRTR